MAYTQDPTTSTYKTVPLEFDDVVNYRSGNLSATLQDSNIINFYYEKIKKESKTSYARESNLSLKKRPGLAASIYSMSKSARSVSIRGNFYDVDQNAFYWAVDNHVYSVKPDSTSTPTLVTTLSTSTGNVGFCSFLKTNNTRLVLISDGIDLWINDFVGGTCVKVVDADMPTPHIPYPVYIDGYVLLIKAGTGDFYNSVNDDPTSWDPTNFLTAEISSDYALRIVKAKNYIVVLGYNSIEYFYDAGGATGSPFARNDSPFRSVGLICGLTTIGDTTYFVGKDDQLNTSVYAINSFKVESISDAIVDRSLQSLTVASDAKGVLNTSQNGYAISVSGHDFYVLTTPQTTWVYDIGEKYWYEWQGSDGTGLKIEGTWGMYNGSCYLAITGQPNISIIGQANYQDFGTNFTCTYTTNPFSADTFRWKNLIRLFIDCDQNAGNGNSSLMQVTWSDQDFADGGSGITRNINVFSDNSYTMACGRFRQRTFRLFYTDNFPLRIRSFMLDINVGTN